jgi:hypothetical protein
MFKRNISVAQVKFAINSGEEIRSYADDKPYPSKLLLVFENEVPLHVVIALNNEEKKCIVVTAYHPETAVWMTDFKTRR